mmetsp:Transcript_18154/g.28431  ORF Transcript_18154/g.28431 Transcript_18154/m.28431 type:complete len:290 (-) Transcript_18154:14-883(-)
MVKSNNNKAREKSKKTGDCCCYLLTSEHPNFKNHTYVGFTVHPPRRLRQHNREIAQGALQTEKKRPWRMVVFVSGFPNQKCALQFEWAWQNPLKSKRCGPKFLKTNPVKTVNRLKLSGKIRYLHEMLSCYPWRRYPLTVNWLGLRDDDLEKYIKDSPKLPPNVSEKYTSLAEYGEEDDDDETGKGKEKESEEGDWEGVGMKSDISDVCMVCQESLEASPEKKTIVCPHKQCKAPAHLLCLARDFLQQEEKKRVQQDLPPSYQLIPDFGICPSCDSHTTWGEVLRGAVDL